MIGQNFNVVVAKLKSAKRPLCVHFIGYLKQLNASEAEAVPSGNEGTMEFGNTEKQPHSAAGGGSHHAEGSDFDD